MLKKDIPDECQNNKIGVIVEEESFGHLKDGNVLLTIANSYMLGNSNDVDTALLTILTKKELAINKAVCDRCSSEKSSMVPLGSYSMHREPEMISLTKILDDGLAASSRDECSLSYGEDGPIGIHIEENVIFIIVPVELSYAYSMREISTKLLDAIANTSTLNYKTGVQLVGTTY